ncbi:hypothetical protein, partial [Novosphingobium fuchskuhlense]|uniref:hypothetical protein n=1 Tax=Novosphingobium fuchskuhlense TaxID=1117702 RepID=UPI001969BED4
GAISQNDGFTFNTTQGSRAQNYFTASLRGQLLFPLRAISPDPRDRRLFTPEARQCPEGFRLELRPEADSACGIYD